MRLRFEEEGRSCRDPLYPMTGLLEYFPEDNFVRLVVPYFFPHRSLLVKNYINFS